MRHEGRPLNWEEVSRELSVQRTADACSKKFYNTMKEIVKRGRPWMVDNGYEIFLDN